MVHEDRRETFMDMFRKLRENSKIYGSENGKIACRHQNIRKNGKEICIPIERQDEK